MASRNKETLSGHKSLKMGKKIKVPVLVKAQRPLCTDYTQKGFPVMI